MKTFIIHGAWDAAKVIGVWMVSSGFISKQDANILLGSVIAIGAFLGHCWHSRVLLAQAAKGAVAASMATLPRSIPCLLVAALLMPLAAQCQTSAGLMKDIEAPFIAATQLQIAVPPSTNSTATTNGLNIFSAGKQFILDAAYFVENTTNEGIGTVQMAALYGLQTHGWGGLLDFQLPIGGTNSIFGAGFGAAYISNGNSGKGGNFYDTTFNASLGSESKILGINIHYFAENGTGYNFNKSEIVNQDFAGGFVIIPITSSASIGIGGAYGVISDYPGAIAAAGGHVTFTF